MTFARTTNLFSAATATATSAVVNTQRRQDEYGKVHFHIVDGPTTVVIKGRVNDDASWAIIETITELDVDLSTDSGYAEIPMWPQMAAEIVAIDGAEVTVWLME